MSTEITPVPYEGNEKYIFVSYSHKDSDRVLPILSHLMEDGFRIWYDDGISPGTEWPEVIARHLNDCELFVSFLSNSYMDSFNCKREIDFAVRKRKTFLAVFLEETQLSLGVEMQISTVQSVDYYKTTPEAFFEKFCQFDVVTKSGCRIDQTAAPAAESAPEPQDVPKVQASAVEQVIKEYEPLPDAASLQSAEVGTTAKATVPAQEQSPTAETATSPSAPKAKRKPVFLIPVLLGVFVFLGIFGAVIGINVLKTGNKITSKSNSTTIDLSDGKVTASVLRKEAKGKTIRRIKLSNCELAVKNKDFWNEIITDKVTEITISGCQMTDGEAAVILSSATGLKVLDFSENQITNVTFENNPKLERADLSQNNIKNIARTNLENLSVLNLSDNELTNLDFLETAVHLKILYADRNRIESIGTLKNCTILNKACLAENGITDVTALKSSQDTIEELNLGNNRITDISVLCPMPVLKKINMDNNELTSLYLVGSTKLSYLSARNNLIDSLSGDWDELTYIDVADNNLSGDYYFIYSEKLRNGFFENNNITELFLCGAAYRAGNYVIYNNPLVKFNTGDELTSFVIYASYNENIGPTLENKIGQHLYLLDCPYDLRVQYEKNWSKYSITFSEKNEIVEAAEKLRKTGNFS